MKIKLPLLPEITIGEDKADSSQVNTINIPLPIKQKTLLGTVLDMGNKSLSSEKTISNKLIEAYYEWVYINVSTLAEEISKLQPELYKTVLKGGVNELVQVDDHPILDLLDRFNETTTQSDAFYLTEAHLDLTGDCFWYLEGGANGGQPTNIYILQPDKVTLELGDVYAGASRLVTGYKYSNVIDGKTIDVHYEPEEILHIKVPNPSNPYRGFSVVEGLATSIDIDTKTLESNKSFYENGMMAQFMLSTDNKLTQDQIKKLNAEMRAAYSGSKNFWKVPIFGGGIKPQTMQMTSRDAEMLAQQAWLRDKIMAAFKNTKISLGITEDVNKASGESALLNWKQSTVKPKMARIIDSINEFLLPRYGDNLILGFTDPVPEDMTRKIAEATSLYNAGIISVNEAREMVDLDTTDDGDNVGTTNPEPTPAGTDNNLPDNLKAVNTKAMFRRMKLSSKKDDWQKAYKVAQPVARKLMTAKKKELDQVIEPRKFISFSNEQGMSFQNKLFAIVDRIEEQFRDKTHSYLDTLTDKIINNYTLSTNTKAVDDSETELFDIDEETIAFTSIITPTLIALAIASSNHANKLVGVNTPYIPDPKVYDYIRKEIDRFAKQGMLSTTRDKAAGIIAKGVEQGLGVPDVTKNLLSTMKDFYNEMETERIARTELMRQSNHFMVEAWKESGVVEGKQWHTDGNPCVTCIGMSVEFNSIGLDDIFLEKGGVMDIGGVEFKNDYRDVEEPPLHPNCQCTLLAVLSSDKSLVTNNTKKL